MTKILAVGDTHFRGKSSPYRVDDFYNMQFDKLRQILQLGEDYKVDGIVFLGDILHTYREGYGLVYDLMGALKASKVPLYTIVGNHDIQGYSLETLQRSPLGVLIQSGALTSLTKDFVVGDIVLRGVDYMSTHSDSHYQFRGYSELLRVACTHNMIIPMASAPFLFTHPDTVKTDADVVLCGHYHIPFDYENAKTRFINPGVPIRWTTNEAKLEPKVIMLTANKRLYSIDYLPLKFNLHAFDLVTPTEVKAEKKDIQNFIQTLETTTFGQNNLEEDIQKYAEEQGLPVGVLQELLNRVKSARGTNGV